MQPLEMILGFNKDEGLHVIIDLLMDPTNDTNFRLVVLLNRRINVKGHGSLENFRLVLLMNGSVNVKARGYVPF